MVVISMIDSIWVEKDEGGSNMNLFAIGGGTGKYDNVEGTAVFDTAGSDGDVTDLQLFLTTDVEMTDTNGKEPTIMDALDSSLAPSAPAKTFMSPTSQRASRQDRKNDPGLIDCGLTHQGVYQATVIPNLLGSDRYRRIGLVVSSPLTRAVQTAVLGFPTKPIVILIL